MQSKDTETHENELATSRFQNLMLVNGLWLLAYFEGIPNLPAGTAKNAHVLLICLGVLSTSISAASLWLGLRYLDQHFKARPGVSRWNLKIIARGHYYFLPPLVSAFWISLADCDGWILASIGISLVFIVSSLFVPLPKEDEGGNNEESDSEPEVCSQ